MKRFITKISLVLGMINILLLGQGSLAQKTLMASTQRSESFPSADLQVIVSGKLALCSHQERGHIQLDVQGGVAPYSFLWNNNQTVQHRHNLFAGTYTVVITDSQGVSVTERIIIQPPFPFIVDLVEKIDATCANGNVGSAKINIRIGRGEPYRIQWSHGLEGEMEANDLRPGAYTVTVSDRYNCDISIFFTVQADPQMLQVIGQVEQPSCTNGQKGAINLQVNGGRAPYTYLWSTGSTNKDLSDLTAGNYLVLVKDSNGCAFQEEFIVKDAAALDVSLLSISDILCANTSDGAIEVSISGGKAPYQINWSNGEQTSTIQNLAAGFFTIEATDSEGCKVSRTFEVKSLAQLVAHLDTSVEMNCQTGEPIGYAWVDITGGLAPYTITWSTGASNTKEITFDKSGDLVVTVEDVNGCSISVQVKVDLPFYDELGRLNFEYKKVEITSDVEVYVAQPLQFTSFIAPYFIAWEWEFGDGMTSKEKEPIHVYQRPGRFEVVLRAYDVFGCSVTETQEVVVLKANEWLSVPSAFTPNGDGLNDFFKPVLSGVSKFEMRVFNNWGEELYATTTIESEGWDGTFRGVMLPRGNYMYRISVVTQMGEVIQRSGSFSLIR